MLFSRRQATAAIAAVPLSGLLAPDLIGQSDLTPSIARAAVAARRQFGVAARHDRIASDPALADEIARQCLSVTPEFDMNWTSLEPRAGERNHRAVDGLAAFAADRGLALRGHTLLWELGTPEWAQRRIAAGDWALVEGHLRDVMTRYPQVVEWEVVNEAIDTEGGQDGYRRTSYFRGAGPGHIARAMRQARGHAPTARLMINDYSLEYDNPVDAARRAMCLRIAAALKRDRLIDAVGIQAHLDLGKGRLNPRVLRRFLHDLRDTGVDVVITELDVKEADRTAPTGLRDSRVAGEVAAFLDVVLAEPHVTGVTTWGLTDRDSWLQADQFAANADPVALNRGLPFDATLRAKPFLWMLRDAFQRHATR